MKNILVYLIVGIIVTLLISLDAGIVYLLFKYDFKSEVVIVLVSAGACSPLILYELLTVDDKQELD